MLTVGRPLRQIPVVIVRRDWGLFSIHERLLPQFPFPGTLCNECQLLTISCQVGLESLHSRRGYGMTSARQLSTDTVKRKKPNLNQIGFDCEGQFPSICRKREIGVEPGTSGQSLN